MVSWTEKRKLIRPGEDYDALLGSAHRHPALATGPLALIRYRCWWVEKNETVGHPEGSGRNFDGDAALLKYCFETARKIILQRLGAEEDADFDEFARNNAGQDHEDPTHPGVNSEYRYFSIPVKLGGGAVLRLTITQHDDRISMSEVLDLIPPDDASNYATPVQDGAGQKTKDLMDNLVEHVTGIKEILEELKDRTWDEGTDRVTREEAMLLLARCKWLQQTFWRHWPVGVFISTPAFPAGEEMRLAADIRGLLVPESLNLLQPPGSREPAPHTLGPDTDVTKPFKDSMTTVRQYWELIKAWEIARTGAPSVPSGSSAVLPRPLSLSDREMVVCKVLHGRAIYASSLGFGRDKGSEAPAFISYVAIASTRNRRQLGRLVDRVSSMGMLRLLAVRDLPKLREASRVIRNLGPELTAIETRINTAAPPLNNDGSDGSEVRPLAEAEAELREFGRKLSAIGSDIRGGLPYRVARARLYAESYDNILTGMRIGRIEGFMPYDEFIRRRVRENFSFISRLGDRHRQLLDRYRTAIELSQSISLRAIAGETNALAKSAHLVEFVAVTYYGSDILLKLSPLIAAHGPSPFVEIACVVLAPVLWFAMRPNTLHLLHSLRKRLGRLGRSQSPSGTGST